MKGYFFILIVALTIGFSGIINAQDFKKPVKWYSMEEAMKLAKEKPKNIFVDIYTNWCGWCTKMDNSTFSNLLIARYMNENYYPVKLNAETRDTIIFRDIKYYNDQTGNRPPHQLAVALLQGRLSYPSYAFLEPNGELITVVKGYIEAKEFEPMLHFLSKDNYKTSNFEEFKQNFKGKIE